MRHPIGLAHRGDWSTYPENTLAAFAAAERAGADMIELDVQRTADGGVVVLHDETLERIWGVARPVAELTLAEVRAVRAGRERIPELCEALEAVALPIMLDYKEESAVLEPALAEVRAAGAVDRVIWAGHNLEGHRQLRELEPDARIALSWGGRTPPSDDLLDSLGVEWFNPSWDVVEPAVVEAMHERGLLVSAWTVDDQATMARLLDLGVDALITNCIADLVALLDGRKATAC
jgi:glycerophosphoryl diester phosphodiesterase